MNKPNHPIHPSGLTEELPIEEIDDAISDIVFREVAKELGIEPRIRKTPKEVAAERAKREAEA